MKSWIFLPPVSLAAAFGLTVPKHKKPLGFWLFVRSLSKEITPRCFPALSVMRLRVCCKRQILCCSTLAWYLRKATLFREGKSDIEWRWGFAISVTAFSNGDWAESCSPWTLREKSFYVSETNKSVSRMSCCCVVFETQLQAPTLVVGWICGHLKANSGGEWIQFLMLGTLGFDGLGPEWPFQNSEILGRYQTVRHDWEEKILWCPFSQQWPWGWGTSRKRTNMRTG